MVVVDHNSTKGVIPIPTDENVTALRTAEHYMANVFPRFGLCDVFLSDRGPQFDSQVMKEICRILSIDQRMSTAYHPQTDGETERMNREIETYFRIYCSAYPDKWVRMLPMAEFAINNRVHSATKYTPFYLMYGSHPKAFLTEYPRTKVPSVEEWILTKQESHEEAQAALELAQQKMAGRIRRTFMPFKAGQQVWLETKNIQTGYPFRKMEPKHEGPFPIKKVLGPLVYQLTLPAQMKCHDVFHASLLTPYQETEQHGENFIAPPPVLIDGHEEEEIESILNHRKRHGNMQYFVKWKGQPTDNNSWEPEESLDNAQETLAKYKTWRKLSLTDKQQSLLTQLSLEPTLQWPPTPALPPSPLLSVPTTLPRHSMPSPHSAPTTTTSRDADGSTTERENPWSTSDPNSSPLSSTPPVELRSSRERAIRPTWKLRAHST